MREWICGDTTEERRIGQDDSFHMSFEFVICLETVQLT